MRHLIGDKPIGVKISGQFACFTRPESRVDRYTYPVITPSASRNILQAVFSDIYLKWIVLQIQLLAPIQLVTFGVNEIKNIPSTKTKSMPRIQRTMTCLSDVCFGVLAIPAYTQDPGCEANPASKARHILMRRLEQGSHHKQPYLGCRDFSAFVEPLNGDKPINIDNPIGPMFLDLNYETGERKFFDAFMKSGVIEVPHEELFKLWSIKPC